MEEVPSSQPAISAEMSVIAPIDDDVLSQSPGKSEGAKSVSKKRVRTKRTRKGQQAKFQYKAASKICSRFSNKSNLTAVESKTLVWARQTVQKRRQHFAAQSWRAPSDPNFTNRIEERIEVDKFIVALIDRSNPSGQITHEKWKLVEMKLLEAMIVNMNNEPGAPMPSFDGAGWCNGVKVLKCNDELSLEWVKNAACTLQGLWDGARIEIVDRKNIPTMPKAKVFIPRVVQPSLALKLLQGQNPDVPTEDWRVLYVGKPMNDNANSGQQYILQINKMAEDILYSRFGKMAWGIGSVYLRIKKRHPKDENKNTLENGEVEKDLGVEAALESSFSLHNAEEEIATIAVVPTDALSINTVSSHGSAFSHAKKATAHHGFNQRSGTDSGVASNFPLFYRRNNI